MDVPTGVALTVLSGSFGISVGLMLNELLTSHLDRRQRRRALETEIPGLVRKVSRLEEQVNSLTEELRSVRYRAA